MMPKTVAAWAVLASLMVGEARAQDANPVLDGVNFDVIAFDDAFITTWHHGGRTNFVRLGSMLSVVSTLASIRLVGVATSARVVVNDGPPIGQGWPQAASGSTQAMAMTGLDVPLVLTPGVAVALTALVTPPAGHFVSPQRLRVAILGGSGGGPSIEIVHNGVTLPPVVAAEAFLTLGVGRNDISVRVTRGGVTSSWLTDSWDVAEPSDKLTDTDGDGVPDLIETAAGLDPLVPDGLKDVDGDGWSNLDEVLRGCPPGAIMAAQIADYPECRCNATTLLCEPRDNDRDGWSNWDEGVRGTNPANDTRYPAARSLYEPELVTTIGAWLDTGVRPTGTAAIEIVDVYGRALPARGNDGRVFDGALNVAPETGNAAVSFGTDHVLRVPGDLPFAARMRRWELVVAYEPRAFAVKALSGTTAPFSPLIALEVMRARGLAFTDVTSYRAQVATLMSEALVVVKNVPLDVRSTSVVALFESLAAWQLAADGTLWLSLGATPNSNSGSLTTAVKALAARYATLIGDDATTNEALADLIAALTAWHDEPSMAAWSAHVRTVQTTAATGSWPSTNAATSDLEIGRSIGKPAYEVARVGARLVAYLGGDALAALTAPERVSLAVPSGDFDSDTLSQAAELAGPAEHATNPLVGDTDGDGDPDATDPCGNDALDACWPGLAGLGDSDGDRILDGVDNCPNVWNGWTLDPLTGLVVEDSTIAQLDVDGNGVGDACQDVATIVSPRSHVNVASGAAIAFAYLRATNIAANDISVRWDFDGAAPDSTAAAPSVAFVQPREYTVTLTATMISTGRTQVDTRRIRVRGAAVVAPTVLITTPPEVFEGQPASFSASADQPVTFTWTFGDGGTATGANVSHTFADDGVYSVHVEGTNANGMGDDGDSYVVLDTEPVVEGEWGDTGVDYELAFDDLSSAYDGIASVTWTVIAPAGVTLSTTGVAAELTFPFSGLFEVRQTVVDGDGSSVSREFEVEVMGSDIQLVGATIDGTWKTFAFGHPMIDPIVIAGVPSANDAAPGVVAIRNVSSTGFQARYAEWAYLDGSHPAESVTFVAMERGRHTQPDGAVWVADSLQLAGPAIDGAIAFSPLLPKRPTILVSAQTAVDPNAVFARVFDPTRTGATVRLYNEESRVSTPHVAETIGWIAIAGQRDGTLSMAGSPVATLAFGARLRHDWRLREGFSVSLAEESSGDAEVVHVFEMADMIVIDDELFGSTASGEELDPFTIRRQ